MLLADFIRQGTEALTVLYPPAEARSLVLLLCEDRLGTRSYTHVTEPAFAVDPAKEALLTEALQRLQRGEPLQYILGGTEFYGRRFSLSPAVLIPRPETEQLCREALRLAGPQPRLRVLDLCTGSGNIAWTMALERPGTEVTAVDLSEAALEVARSQSFPLPEGAVPPVFLQADVLAPVLPSGIEGPFDLILSNPPYVMEREKLQMRPNVLEYEPASALFVPDADPLCFYRAIARHARSLLAPDGIGLVEINEQLGEATCALFRSAGFPDVALLQDIFGKDRFVRFR